MFENYAIYLLIPLCGLGILSILMSIWIFCPQKIERKKSQYKSKSYGKDYYKTKKYPNINEVLQTEIAQQNEKF